LRHIAIAIVLASIIASTAVVVALRPGEGAPEAPPVYEAPLVDEKKEVCSEINRRIESKASICKDRGVILPTILVESFGYEACMSPGFSMPEEVLVELLRVLREEPCSAI